jgi:hypothetical protein
MDKFVKENPYPTYKEMMNKLDNHMDLFSEYGKMQHNWCKTIYENPTNKDIIIETGKKIYRLGGMQALVSNNTILKYFSPYWDSLDSDIKNQGDVIDLYFAGVTLEWTNR